MGHPSSGRGQPKARRGGRAQLPGAEQPCQVLPMGQGQLREGIPQPAGDPGQLSGRRHYSPRWTPQTAAGWSNSEQPHGPIQNWPWLSTITFLQTTGFTKMTETRSSMIFHSALTSLGYPYFIFYFFFLKEAPKSSANI